MSSPFHLPLPGTRAFENHADATALLSGNRSLTYGQLLAAMGRVAGKIVDSGIRPGERMAVLAENSLEYGVLVHAAAACGVTLVPLNTRLTSSDWDRQIQTSEASRILVSEKCRAARGNISPADFVLNGILNEAGPSIDIPQTVDPLFPATIMFTSGTGGRLKGVVLPLRSHHHSALGSAGAIPVDVGDRWLACLPFFHVGGIAILYRCARVGATVEVADGFDPDFVLGSIRSGALTHLSLIPGMLEQLLDRSGNEPFPNSVKAVMLGGAAGYSDLWEKCRRLRVPVINSYGLTETASHVTATSSSDPADKWNTAGRLLPHRRLRIAGPDDRALPLGTVGEIQVAGPVLMKGYLNETLNAFAFTGDRFFRTGDLGMLDEEGYLHVEGRSDDMIVSGGENIRLHEIEKALLAHPDLSTVAVLAAEDKKWGQRPVAFVVARPNRNAREQDIRKFLCGRLAGFKVPDRILILTSIPLSGSGKVDREALLRMLTEDE